MKNATIENEQVSRILIHEDENSIRAARDYVGMTCRFLQSILQNLLALDIGPVQISDVLTIAHLSDQGILNTIKSKMIERIKEPLTIGGLKLSKEKAMELISTPSLSALTYAVTDYKEFKKNDFQLNHSPYAGIKSFTGFEIDSNSVVLIKDDFETFCDRWLRTYATSEKELRAYEAVKSIVDLLNEELIQFTNNVNLPSQPRDHYWNENSLKNILSFNAATERFYINPSFFKG